MPVANSIPMSSMVGPPRTGGSSPPPLPPPPPLATDNNNESATESNNNGRDHAQDDRNQESTTYQERVPTSSSSTTTATTTTTRPFVGDHHHFREQEQDYLHGTDTINDDECVQEKEEEEEEDGDVDDDDDVWSDEDESEPDPVYVADFLRQSGIDWMQYPEYATHRLVVTSTSTIGEEEEEARQYYRVMAQFLVPASAVFQDFLHGMPPSSDDDGDEERQEFHKARLACLQDGPLDPILGNNDAFLNPSNPPAPELTHSLLEPLTPFIYRRNAPYEPHNPHQPPQQEETDPLAHQPWIHLSLPHPSHFPGLLQAIYTMDLRQWEEICFRPETIAAITAMVSRLECSSVLTVCCLEYYRKIKAILGGVEEFEELQSGDGNGGEVEELKRLYKAAVESGMLPPDPDL